MKLENLEIPEWLVDDAKRRDREARKSLLRKTFVFLLRLLILCILLAIFEFLFLIKSGMFNQEITYIAEERKEIVAEIKHKVVFATVTAYTSSVDETDDTPFITASGARTGHGVIACPSKYDFGTKIVIEGRQYTCEDRMNRRYRDQERFDIWVETKDDAFTWGIRELEIIVLAQK